MRNNEKWFHNQVKQYQQDRENYIQLADVLQQILFRASEIYSPLAIIQTRPKSVSSFAEKCLRKADKHIDPVHQLTDLCGGRIVCHTNTQVQRLCRFICDEFVVDKTNSLDASSRLRSEEFGYLSVHFIVEIDKEKILGIGVPKSCRNLKAEIQIRTLLQHTWADIIHDLIYKTPIQVPAQFIRESARLAAILEKADESFEKFMNTLQTYKDSAPEMFTQKQFETEKQTLEMIQSSESDPARMAQIAIRQARLYRSTDQYDEVITVLRNHIDFNKEPPDEALYYLAEALLMNKEDSQYSEGQSLLKRIIEANSITSGNIDNLRLMNPKSFKILTKAYHLLGTSLIEKDMDEALPLLRIAFHFEPDNPRYIVDYIECCLLRGDSDCCELLKPMIQNAIEQCSTNLDIYKSRIESYLIKGRLLLCLNQWEDAMFSYIKAIDVICKQKTNRAIGLLLKERKTLTALQELLDDRGWKWAVEILGLAYMIIYRKKAAGGKHYIIAGKSDFLDDETREMMTDSFYRGFRWGSPIIISGGTNTGIPGCIGDAVLKIKAEGCKLIRLHGYVHSNVPDQLKHEGYDDWIVTDDDDFSFGQVLAYWSDLLPYCDIKLIGYGGGTISGLEYRLALAMGAKVALIQESGGAAEEVYHSPEWEKHEGLIVLPKDADTIVAFINDQNDSPLYESDFESIAREIHNHYLEEEIKNGKTASDSMAPWELLPETYKASNRNQAAFWMFNLLSNGFGFRGGQPSEIVPITFTDDEIERLSKLEHGRWSLNRLKDGWVYSPEKYPQQKKTPWLIGWNDLLEEIREYDRNAVRQIPALLAGLGFEIIRGRSEYE